MKNKTKFFLALLLLVVNLSYANNNKATEISAPITSIKVSLNAAELTHSINIKLNKGINKFAFLGLASLIDKQHIRLQNIGVSELISLEVITLNDSTNIQLLPIALKEIIGKSKDTIQFLEKLILKNQLEIKSFRNENEMLMENDEIVSNTKQISTAELKTAVDYFRERRKEIGIELSAKQNELQELKKKKVKILKSIFNADNDSENNLQCTVILTEILNPNSTYNTDIQLTYLAQESGWIPVYEIFGTNNANLKINYRAKILNNTGIDWNNMKITITSANPFEYYSAPDLDPLYINRYNRNRNNQNRQEGENINPEVGKDVDEIFTPDKEILFNIAKSYTYKSGKNPTFIDVTTYDIVANFFYRCAPKKEEQAYAIAQIKDWEKLNLLDGEASIFNNNNFLGKMYIKPSEFDDYFEIPLGAMEKIYVRHKLASEFSSKKVLLGEVVATQTYEIKLKNIGNEKVNLEILDQIPVAEERSVKAELLDVTEGYEFEPLTGKIIWKIDLTENSEKTIKLKYSVSYPKGRGFGLNQSYGKKKTRAKF